MEGVIGIRAACALAGGKNNTNEKNSEVHLVFENSGYGQQRLALLLFVVWILCFFIMFLVVDTHTTHCQMAN